MVGASTPRHTRRIAALSLLFLMFAVLMPGQVTADPIDDAIARGGDAANCLLLGEGDGCDGPCEDGCGGDPCGDGGCPDPCNPTCPWEGLVGDVLDIIGSVTGDYDSDGVPDGVEAELCAREGVRNLINNALVPGKCDSSTDFDPQDIYDRVDTVWVVVGIVTGVAHSIDLDSDGVPDALEPTICSLEDQNRDIDGSCVGNNYTP